MSSHHPVPTTSSAFTRAETGRSVSGQALTTECKTHRQFNPRYIAYAVAHGKAPEDMINLDAEQFPGGTMAGFILWIGARWREWEQANGRGSWDVRSPADHASFDAYIGTDALTVAD